MIFRINNKYGWTKNHLEKDFINGNVKMNKISKIKSN